jgi:hypothetical protein
VFAEILINDLASEFNNLFFTLINYIFTEQKSPDWIFKTSFVDVYHNLRELKEFPNYVRDNQSFYDDYINEVKPYRVKLKDFSLKYTKTNVYDGDITDFDLPAQWDPAQSLFISPVLDNTGTLSTTSSVPSTAAVWSTFPYNQWFNNYLLNIDSITIVNGGSGYTVGSPTVTISAPQKRQNLLCKI